MDNSRVLFECMCSAMLDEDWAEAARREVERRERLARMLRQVERANLWWWLSRDVREDERK